MKILITGASGGLGLSLTTEALKRGHSVIAACLFDPATEEGIVKLRKEYPEALFPIQMDVSNEEDVKARAQEVLREHPVIDCVINNAGVLLESKYDLEDPIPNLDIAKLRKSIEVNAVGHAIVLKYFIPGIYASSKPCIINITSEAGHLEPESYTYLAYSVSKHAANMYSQKIRNYLAQSPEHSNVRLFMLHPGRMFTEMGKENAQIQPEVSARGILDIVEGKIDPKLDIQFIDYQGNPMPY